MQLDDKIIIGLDCDGVILDHTENKIRVAKQFGITLTAMETPTSLMRQKVSKPIRQQIQELIYHDPKIAFTAPLVVGVVEVLTQLKTRRTPFFLISRRRDPVVAQKILEHHRLWPRFFNEKNAFFVSEPEDKEKMCKQLGVTVYLDDEPDVLDILCSVKNRFLFDPLDVYSESLHTRVSSWKEFNQKVL